MSLLEKTKANINALKSIWQKCFYLLRTGQLRTVLLSKLKMAINHRRHKNSYVKTKIFFMHIPKTGGTSIYHMLSQKFYSYRLNKIKTGNKQHSIRAYECIAGHIPYSKLRQQFPGYNYKIIVFTRDPINRFVSSIKHRKRVRAPQNTTNQHGQARELSILDYTQTPKGKYKLHLQLLFLAKANGYHGKDLNQAYQEAKQFIHQDNVTLCLTEQMDTSIKLLNKQFNACIPKVLKVNTSKQHRHTVDDKEITTAHDTLCQLTSLDYQLHEDCKKAFFQSCEENGISTHN
mgnify:CR=1 FL=1|jgi:hypothetical protein